MKQKGCFLFIILFVAFVIVIVLQMPKGEDYNSPYYQKIRTGVLGKISFKGRVINYKVVHNEQFGRNYLVMCIKLDYSDTDSFYYFDDENALKIKNGIATMSSGSYQPNYKPTYVEINVNHNYKNIFYYADNSKDTFALNFTSNGISKEDMNYCN